MKKGFSIAIFSALAVLLLSAAFGIVSSSSTHLSSQQVFYESRQVAGRFDDSKNFLKEAVYDAAVDSHFASSTYGCLGQGGFCAIAKKIASAYLNYSLDLLNDSATVYVNASEFLVGCNPLTPPAAGYNATYNLTASFVLSVNSSSVRKSEPVLYESLVDVYKETGSTQTLVRIRNSTDESSFVYNITIPC